MCKAAVDDFRSEMHAKQLGLTRSTVLAHSVRTFSQCARFLTKIGQKTKFSHEDNSATHALREKDLILKL